MATIVAILEREDSALVKSRHQGGRPIAYWPPDWKETYAAFAALAVVDSSCSLTFFAFSSALNSCFHLESNGVGIDFVGSPLIAQNNGRIGSGRRQKNGGLDQQTRESTLLGSTNESRKELTDCVRLSVFPYAVLPREGLKPPLVQQRSDLVEEELHVAFE